MASKSILFVGVGVVASVVIIAHFALTLFMIQPIGMLPEGRTLVTSRIGLSSLIDGEDAIFERQMGGISLLCRSITIGKYMEETTLFFRSPYSETLCLWSTDGRKI